MRALSLPWLIGAAGVRVRSEPDRIRMRLNVLRPSHRSNVVGLLDLAVARDDLPEARRLLGLVSLDDPQQASVHAAVELLAGEITAAEATARGVLQTPTAGTHGRAARARAHRVLRRARALRDELGHTPGDGAPTVVTAGAPRADRQQRQLHGPLHGPVHGPLRVLHVVKNSLPYVHAGYTLRTHAILRTHRARGIDAQAITRLGFPVVQGYLGARSDVIDGVRYRRLLSARGSDVQEYGRRLTGLARAQGVDVLHAATDHVNGQAAMIAADALHLPLVYEVRGFLEDSWACRHGGDDQASSTDRYRWSRERETDVMLAADAVITLSDTMAAEITSRGVPRDRIWIVPNGVDDTFLTEPRTQRVMQQALGLSPERVWVGAVTSLHSFEGLATLLAAIERARSAGRDVGAVIVGDGPARRELQASSPSDGSVRWIDRVAASSARDWYDALDAVVVPRDDLRVTRLVTPLKPVEALARGRLVIASDLPALREATGGHARFVPPGDAEALAAEFDLIDEHRDLGRQGRAWVGEHRRWSQVCEGHLAAYASVVG